jgi:hypothetical protein
MFPKATSGTDSNNRKFSKCSRDYIAPVLQTKADKCLKREYEYMYGGAWCSGLWWFVVLMLVALVRSCWCLGSGCSYLLVANILTRFIATF